MIKYNHNNKKVCQYNEKVNNMYAKEQNLTTKSNRIKILFEGYWVWKYVKLRGEIHTF